MQKWEYMVLLFAQDELIDHQSDKNPLAGDLRLWGLTKRGEKIQNILSAMGKEGWEVVGMAGEYVKYQVILKRPMP